MSSLTKQFYLLTFCAIVFLCSFDISLAQNLAGSAGCDGPDCSACNIVSLANSVINWLIAILTLVFAVIAVVAGFGLVTSGGNQSALDAAKSKFTNAIIGFIIVLSAWLVVDTIFRALVSQDGVLAGAGRTGALLWSEIECQDQRDPQVVDESDRVEVYLDGTPLSESGLTESPAGTAATPGATTPVVATGDLATYAGAQFDSGIIDNVRMVSENFSLRVSGGYRTPERNAAVGGVPNSNHLTGRAADFVGTSQNMQRAREWALANGASEAIIHDAGSGVHLHVAW